MFLVPEDVFAFPYLFRLVRETAVWCSPHRSLADPAKEQKEESQVK